MSGLQYAGEYELREMKLLASSGNIIDLKNLVQTIEIFEDINSPTLSGNITLPNDASITYSGKIMRKYKLDEFPQLINILIGDMSFVGPRPDVPGYADNLPDKYKILLTLKPGITCPASLFLKNEEKILGQQIDKKKFNDEFLWPYKVRSNLQYLKEWSFFYDIKLIFMTIWSILKNIF